MKIPVSWKTSSMRRRKKHEKHRDRGLMYTELASGHTAQGRSHLEEEATNNGVISRASWFHHYKWWFNGDSMVSQWVNNGE